MAQNTTTVNQYSPALSLNFPIPLSDLQVAGATNGQVIVYSSSAGAWIPGSGGRYVR